jgi:AraC family transcriptional regulator
MTRTISSQHVRATWYDRKSLEVLDWHEHRNLSFCFVIAGDYEETTRRQTFTCRPGDVVVKTADVRHLNTFGQRGAVCLLLEMSNEFLEDSMGSIEPEINGPLHDYRLARIGLELREELRVADRLSPIMLEGIALRSLGSLLRLEKGKSERPTEIEAMRALLDAGSSVDDVIQKYLTANERKRARRLFCEIEGCSINTYALRRRAFRAFEELVNTDDSLAQISLRSGFYDQAHFTKMFATMFGITPGRLRSRIDHQ